MMYLVTDGGVRFVDDEYKPITIDEALVTIRRIAAQVEAIGNEPKRDDDADDPLNNETAMAIALET